MQQHPHHHHRPSRPHPASDLLKVRLEQTHCRPTGRASAHLRAAVTPSPCSQRDSARTCPQPSRRAKSRTKLRRNVRSHEADSRGWDAAGQVDESAAVVEERPLIDAVH